VSIKEVFVKLPSRKSKRSRGIAVLLTSVMLVGALTAVGLAIDVGMMYAIKTKLSAAVDAAALAGARAVGTTPATAAQSYFNANMPTGYMLATGISATTPAPTTSGNITTMTVSAQATLPLLFLRALGPTTDIKVSATAQRRRLNLVMVLDASGSMGNAATAGTPCNEMKAAATNVVNTQFVEGQDAIGLIVFGGSWDATFPLNTTFKSGLTSQIATITCNGNTGSAQAIWKAYQWLKVNPTAAGAINTIVFFTDGQPNGLSADWPITTLAALKAASGDSTITQTPSYTTTNTSPGVGSSGGSGGVTNTSTTPWTLAYAPSGCTGAVTVGGIPTIQGVIARNGEAQHGIYNTVAQSAGKDGTAVSNSAGCAFVNSSTDPYGTGLSGDKRVHEDVGYIPATDMYGNSTSGYWDNATTAAATCNTSTIVKVVAGTASKTNPYPGKVLLDHYSAGGTTSNPCGLFDNNIDIASMNAAEDAAFRARTDATVPVIIFTIGLGGASDQMPDQFLKHVANSIDSDVHSSHTAEPTGQYIFSPTASQLSTAFLTIASYVQRLSS
jgi:Flp pilus assembly protein TadG